MAHILFFTPVDLSGNSGQNIYSLKIVEELLKIDNHQVTVIAPEPSTTISLSTSNQNRLYYIRKKRKRSILWNLSIQTDIVRSIYTINKNLEIDVIITTLRPTGLSILPIKKILNTEYIMLIEGQIDNEIHEVTNSNVAGYMMGVLTRVHLSAADSIFVAYKELIPWVQSRLYTKKEIIHQPHGINEKFLKIPLHVQNKNQQDLIVGYVGSFKKYHHVSSLIRATNQLRKQGYNIVLRLIGDGPEYQRCLELVSKLNLENRVQFEGFIDNNKLPKYISECDLMYGVIDPDRSGSPMKVYEYLAAGRPVIAYASEELSFIDEYNCGFLINEIKDSNIAAIIAEYSELNDRVKNRMMKNSREYILSNGYTWEQFVQNVLESVGMSS